MPQQTVDHFVHQMQSELEMRMVRELTCFLGFQVKQMNNSIFISQSKYAKGLVKIFGREIASHKLTPAPTHFKLTMDQEGIDVDQSLHRNIIGSLLYLTANRPDISYPMGVCDGYQSNLNCKSVYY